MNITNEIISPERLSENKLELVRDEEAFFKEIADIRLEYEAAIKEISTKLEILDDDFKQHDDHGPIHHIQYRLKSVNSMFDKAVRYMTLQACELCATTGMTYTCCPICFSSKRISS